MKTFIYLLGLGVLGYAGYSFFTKKDDETIITNPPTNAYLQTQPQQQYPLQAIETPRVDNADQPWYGGDRSFMGVVTDALSPMSDSGGGYLSYNTNEMWSQLANTYVH